MFPSGGRDIAFEMVDYILFVKIYSLNDQYYLFFLNILIGKRV